MRKTPHPAEAGSKEAEPSVYRTMSGLDRGGCPKVNGWAMYSSAFLRDLNLL